MNCLMKSISSNILVSYRRHTVELSPLVGTEYVIRAAKGKRRKNVEDDRISYGGIYERLLECERQYEALDPDIGDFSATFIRNCGKSHYVKRYMDEGYKETEALIKVLKRCGEWNYNGSLKDEVKLDTNKIRMARLRRSYSLYL